MVRRNVHVPLMFPALWFVLLAGCFGVRRRRRLSNAARRSEWLSPVHPHQLALDLARTLFDARCGSRWRSRGSCVCCDVNCGWRTPAVGCRLGRDFCCSRVYSACCVWLRRERFHRSCGDAAAFEFSNVPNCIYNSSPHCSYLSQHVGLFWLSHSTHTGTESYR